MWRWSSPPERVAGPQQVNIYTTQPTSIHYIEFLLALCPFFLFAFASFPSMNPEGSFPSSSHFSSIFVAAWYPFSSICSNLPHCSVPYYQFGVSATYSE